VQVTDVRCVVVPREKLPAPSVAMDLVVVRVLTDEGIEGNCFAWGGTHGEATAQLIDALVKPQVVGEDPRYTERTWQKMRWRDRFGGHLPRYPTGRSTSRSGTSAPRRPTCRSTSTSARTTTRSSPTPAPATSRARSSTPRTP
jgi:L-alanine-DL-glutamate epimerase-like enolase superfamily enzyme